MMIIIGYIARLVCASVIFPSVPYEFLTPKTEGYRKLSWFER